MIENYIELRKTARLAGIYYLVLVVTGIFSMLYISSKIIIPNDAVATAQNMLANETLFRGGIIVDIMSSTTWILIGLALYKLFRQVNEEQAKLLVSLVIVQIPLLFIMEGLKIASLMAFKGEILKAMELTSRQELAMLLLQINGYITTIAETFWGLWLFPIVLLIYRSGFIPKIFGILLLLNGIAYVIHSFTSVLFPAYQESVKNISMPFWIAGEIPFALWLLIKGVRVRTKN